MILILFITVCSGFLIFGIINFILWAKENPDDFLEFVNTLAIVLTSVSLFLLLLVGVGYLSLGDMDFTASGKILANICMTVFTLCSPLAVLSGRTFRRWWKLHKQNRIVKLKRKSEGRASGELEFTKDEGCLSLKKK